MSLDTKERTTFFGLAKKLREYVILAQLGFNAWCIRWACRFVGEPAGRFHHSAKGWQVDYTESWDFPKQEGDNGQSEKCKIAADAIKIRKFQSVELKPASAREMTVNHNQFYQALCDNLSCRMSAAVRDIVTDIQLLLPSSWRWPDDMQPEYGEQELRRMCIKFLLPFSAALKSDYRDFKDSRGCTVGSAFAQLQRHNFHVASKHCCLRKRFKPHEHCVQLFAFVFDYAAHVITVNFCSWTTIVSVAATWVC